MGLTCSAPGSSTGAGEEPGLTRSAPPIAPFARANDHAAQFAVRIFAEQSGWTLDEAAWELDLAQLVQSGQLTRLALAKHFAAHLQTAPSSTAKQSN